MALLCAWAPCVAWSQTPSPLLEWQYESGIILANLFEPNLPKWRVIAGPSGQLQPLYDGSRIYRAQGGPLIDIRYRNIAY
ncbi:MAG: MipA/OmpV family protein, partial [Steroidobacteraceae bacterium]